MFSIIFLYFFFFNDTATTEIYTLSLHDALPIYVGGREIRLRVVHAGSMVPRDHSVKSSCEVRSEEHTSELQSRLHLVCRLLLEKKKNRRSPEASRFSMPPATRPEPAR